jgi:hypothetical protein
MKKLLLTFFLLGIVNFLEAQIRPKPSILQKDTRRINDTTTNSSISRNSKRGTSNNSIKNKNVKIFDYKIISHTNDTTYVDTTLTIKKEYKYNYLRKDNFELLPFNNIGQTYNTLSYDFSSEDLMPSFGFRAKHFNYSEIEDVNYYYVPTPLTELMFKTVSEQGQLVDAFFTTNVSKQLNFSINYKGLRSLGKYQHILASTGNVRFTTNYKTKNNRYKARAHIYMQDVLTEENGGIRDEDIINFENGVEEFIDRSVFDPVFEDAESVLRGKRFYLDHDYSIIRDRDSVSHNTLKIGNIVSFEDKYYHYTQSSQNDYFGNSFRSSNLSDRVTLEDFFAQVNAKYSNNIIGDVSFHINYNDYNYGYNSVVNLNNQTITNRLKGNVISVVGSYKKQFGDIIFDGKIGVNVSGDFDGNLLVANAQYKLNDDLFVKASINSNSKSPDYNFLLYHSDYINYNWQNKSFDNIQMQQLTFDVVSEKWVNISLDYTTINNYTYFKQSEIDKTFVEPFQSEETINYFRIKLEKSLKYRKFTLDNTIMYQNVINGEGEFNVPKLITRNTLYYSNHFFKKALFLQTGITFQYFSKYNMNAYNPLLGEFQVQDINKLGGFPRFDFFINAKVQQTRIYLKAEHFNSSFTGYDFYSAPNYPYTDFVLRFGLVWNFFL